MRIDSRCLAESRTGLSGSFFRIGKSVLVSDNAVGETVLPFLET